MRRGSVIRILPTADVVIYEAVAPYLVLTCEIVLPDGNYLSDSNKPLTWLYIYIYMELTLLTSANV